MHVEAVEHKRSLYFLSVAAESVIEDVQILSWRWLRS